jgi:CheY-like chemotaxis protein
MNDTTIAAKTPVDNILVVEDEVLVRTAIAEYLRHCGYDVIEAASADEAITILTEPDIKIDIVLSDIEMPGSMDGFGLAQWVRTNRPELKVVLTGTMEKAAHAAGNLCEKGPHLKKPYEPQQVVEWIKRLRNSKL